MRHLQQLDDVGLIVVQQLELAAVDAPPSVSTRMVSGQRTSPRMLSNRAIGVRTSNVVVASGAADEARLMRTWPVRVPDSTRRFGAYATRGRR